MILARDAEWDGYRGRITGILRSIIRGEGDDEAAEALSIEKIEKIQKSLYRSHQNRGSQYP